MYHCVFVFYVQIHPPGFAQWSQSHLKCLCWVSVKRYALLAKGVSDERGYHATSQSTAQREVRTSSRHSPAAITSTTPSTQT